MACAFGSTLPVVKLFNQEMSRLLLTSRYSTRMRMHTCNITVAQRQGSRLQTGEMELPHRLARGESVGPPAPSGSA